MDVLVGHDTNIGEGTTVTQSVIGSACQIGSQVNITNAYIWNNVVIKVNELKLPSFFLIANDSMIFVVVVRTVVKSM